MIVSGTIVRGLRAASKTLVMQWQTLERHVPRLENCEKRTINVQLDNPLIIEHPDISFFVEWGGRIETIHMLETLFEYPLGGTVHTVWIYRANNSRHSSNPFHVELLAKKIDGVETWGKCKLHLTRAKAVI